MTRPYWENERIDWRARGSETDVGLRLPGDPPGSLRSADGHTQDFYSLKAGGVEETAGIREVDASVGAAQVLVLVFALLVLGFACMVCEVPQWLGAWMVTW